MKSLRQFGHVLWIRIQLITTQFQNLHKEESVSSRWPLRFVFIGTELLALGIVLVYWWGRSRGQ